MKKRILSVIVSLSLLLTILPVTALSFDDGQAADALYSLGLFKGVGTNGDGSPDYALTRTPTRSEAITMLVRLLGKEEAAVGGNWVTPFTDVESWALPYVGYAYTNGLTSGTSETTFSGGAYISATQYLTFVLRALGYSDGSDFSWNAAWELSDTLGFTSGEYTGSVSFDRGDIAAISCKALSQAKKNTTTTLLSALLQDGAVTSEQIEASGLSSALTAAVPAKRTLTSEEIYAKCSPAVFYIITYDVTGEGYATGSGFFIDADGTAVTNYHVIEDAFAMTIAMTDGTVCSDVSVLAFDIERDVAVLKVTGAAPFPCLTVNESAVAGGQTVYAIGNPLGLTNTISSGLVSNPSRTDQNNNTEIQISVPISSGSSGGALLNQYGEAVGITSSILIVGQNLNFAIPIGTAVQLPRGDGMTLADVAAQGDIYDYYNAPYPFAANYIEIEPNDYNYEACYLDNGDSVWGIMDDGEYDTVLARCDTTGIIRVCLFSYSGATYFKDLILAVETYDYEDFVLGSLVEYDDGTLGLRVEYRVTEPGIYLVNVLSNSLYQYGSLYTDYAFYYLFTPDGASDTDGSASSSQAVQTYSDYPQVPDFGAYFGLAPTYTDSQSDFTTYDYHMFAVNTVTTLEDCIKTYGRLLTEWGFTFLQTFQNDYGYDVYTYVNEASDEAVYFGLYVIDGMLYFDIMVHD